MIITGAVYVELQTGNTYRVTSLAEHTETGACLVIFNAHKCGIVSAITKAAPMEEFEKKYKIQPIETR